MARDCGTSVARMEDDRKAREPRSLWRCNG